MDSSLWDPPFYEDDSSDFGGNWQSDFYFDLGHDVMEEDAINERCCIQVLNILMPKADTEIEEREQEIILLQGQLAWTDEVQSKICSTTLTERINLLDLSIQRLKNEKLQKEHELDFGFQTHGDPAQNEKLQMEHEVNSSFRTHGDPAQHEKPQIEHELHIRFQTLGEPSQKEKPLMQQEQNFHFQTHEEPAHNEKLQTEHEVDFHFQAHGKPAPKHGEIIKTLLEKYSPNIDEKNSSSNTEKLATCQSKNETKLSNFEALDTVAKTLEETVEPLHLEASKMDEKETHQNGDTTIPDSITILFEHASDVSMKRKMNEISSSIEIGQGEGMYGPTSKADKRMYATQIEKEACALMINTSANALRYEAGTISKKRGCNQSEETCGGLVVQSLKIESANFKPSSMPKETTNAEADMLADMASVCMSQPIKQIAKESISKPKMKMLADADRTDRVDTPQQQVRTERMPTESSPRMKQEEVWLSDSERTIGESFLELLNKKRKDTRKPLIKERLKPQLLKQMQNTEVVGTEPSKSKFLLKTESPNLTEKHFPTFESRIVPEPSLAMEMELKLSSMKSLKRKLMSRIIDEKNFENKKIKEETHLDFSGEKNFSVLSDVSIHSALQSLGKRKKCIISPLIEKNEELRNLQVIQKMHEGKMNALVKEEDEQISNFHAAKDASEKPLKLLSCTASVATVDLKSLSMDQLRAMAKEHNLTKYSKLNKSDLIKLLEQRSR